jgi:enoyl-CoA hydratase/carnithine racemase
VAGFSLVLAPSHEWATITLDRPETRNAQTPHTWLALHRSLNDLPGTVRAVLVRADGPSFSAGLDRSLIGGPARPGLPTLAELARLDPDAADRRLAAFQAGFAALARPQLFTVALVQGHAVGAGFQLALACDLRIAAEDAQFTMAEVHLGLVPDLGGTKRLTELVGYSRALDICLTGRRVAAEEAHRLGLVNAVVPAGELREAGERLIAGVLGRSRTAVTEIKALLIAAGGRTPAEQQRAERQAQYSQLRELAGIERED